MQFEMSKVNWKLEQMMKMLHNLQDDVSTVKFTMRGDH